MSGPLPIDHWMDVMEAATSEVAVATLGVGNVERFARLDEPSTVMSGAYLPLVGVEDQLQIALAALPDDCGRIARAMLGMAETDDLPIADVADAINELVNIIAGGVKSKVFDRLGALQLGLPIFIHGPPQPTGRLRTRVTPVRIGETPAVLMVVQHREQEA